MSAARLFDVYCVVDWSANATPKRGADSIWISELVAGQPATAVNVPTRHGAEQYLAELAARHACRRVLIGVDFPLGYPAGFAAAAGLAGPAGLDGSPAWLATWQYLAQAIDDDHRNRNNRWHVAADLNERLGGLRFWGCPPRRAGTHLSSRRPPGDWPLTLRRTEAELRSHTGRSPFTVWHLLGAGSVGSQALTGIPVMHRLRSAIGAVVWPFETGFAPDPCQGRAAAVVVAEVWPSTVPPGPELPKDHDQVLALARHFAALDEAGELGALFTAGVPAGESAGLVDEEGWVLGAVFRVHQDRHAPLET